jgi:lysophospholipase L1-like esterase
VSESKNPEVVASRRRVFRAMYSFWGLVAVVVVIALLLSACGGDDPSPAPAAADDTTLIAALGDSITAGSPLWDPDPAVRDGIGPALDEHSQFEFWASREDPSLEFRNCGVFGERTDEIAQRLAECAGGAGALIVQGGINDIAQGVPPGIAAGNLESMVRTGKDLGIPVALAEVLPWNNGHPTADGPIARLNVLIGRIGAEQDVPVLPFHETLEGPEGSGLMREDLTIDGDHPSVEGYRLLGQAVAEELNP